MVTIIDMVTGEITTSVEPIPEAAAPRGIEPHDRITLDYEPQLAVSESATNAMPPEIAHLEIDAVLAEMD